MNNIWEARAWSCHAKTTVMRVTADRIKRDCVVAECETEEDAALIAQTPSLLRFAKDIACMAEHQFRTCNTVGSTGLFYDTWQKALAVIALAEKGE